MKLAEARKCMGHLLLCALTTLALGTIQSALAEITVGGDPGEVSPADVATWDSDTYAYIGINAGKLGTLTVNNGSSLESGRTTLGQNPGASGFASVDGSGSTWNAHSMNVGLAGLGELNIANGGLVSVLYETEVGDGGSIHFNGGTLDTTRLYAHASTLTGTGTVLANGWVVDGTDVTLANGSSTTHVLNNEVDQNITMQLFFNDEVAGAGHSGTGSLTIANGSTIRSSSGYAGSGLGSNGTVTVTGEDTEWSVDFRLRIGAKGTGTVNVNHGGKIKVSDWTTIGYEGLGTLNITDGGTVSSRDRTFLGFMSSGVGQANVDGPGSAWYTKYTTVGREGTGELNIMNGGLVTATSISVGGETGSQGTLNVDGTGSRLDTWTLRVGSQSDGQVNITNGGLIEAGETVIDQDRTTGSTIHFDNGSLETGTLDAHANALTGTGSVTAHGWIVDGADIHFANGSNTAHHLINHLPGQNITLNLIYDGDYDLGAGNNSVGSMTVSNGSSVTGRRGDIGRNSTGDGTVTVVGPGSSWACATLSVGYRGTGTLNVNHGGAVTSGGYDNVGLYAGSSGTISVDGIGSTLTSNGPLTVGGEGSALLGITNGGVVTTTHAATIGSVSGSHGEVTVDGAGSTWDVGTSLSVGKSGTALLTISNGGRVAAESLTVGAGGAVVLNQGALELDELEPNDVAARSIDGVTGVGTVITHSWLFDNDAVFDATNLANGPSDVFDGSAGLTATVAVRLDGKGISGAGNAGTGSITAINGAQIAGTTGYIGYQSTGDGTVTIDGPGTSWTNSQRLFVGYAGSGTLNILNGGQVSNTLQGYVRSANATTSVVNVDGDGSTWINGGDLSISTRGSLNITNGGSVSARQLRLSSSTGDSIVTVSGVDASLHLTDNLYVGLQKLGVLNIGPGAMVTVEGMTEVSTNRYADTISTIHFDGGTLISTKLRATADNLTGTGTISTRGWVIDEADAVFDNGTNSTQAVINNSVDKNITVNLTYDGTSEAGAGYTGNGSLTVANGSAIHSTYGFIGYQAGSNGTVNVDGAGSSWTVAEELQFGLGESILNITQGGVVSCGSVTTDPDRRSTSTTINVIGEDSVWSVEGMLSIGAGKQYSTMTMNILDGGKLITKGNTGVGLGEFIMSTHGDIRIEGTGSEWISHGNMRIYSENRDGSVSVLNGASVTIMSNLYFSGYGREEGQSAMVVDGDGSSLSVSGYIQRNAYHDGSSFPNGALRITNGGYVSADRLRPNNDDLAISLNDGTLELTHIEFDDIVQKAIPGVKGTGKLITHSWIFDRDVTFDSDNQIHGLTDLIDAASGFDATVDVVLDGKGYSGAGAIGTGTMNVVNGSQIASTTGYIGHQSTADGTVNIDGPGSSWNNSERLYVGYEGTGTMNVINGGQVSNAEQAYVGYASGSVGVVNVDGIGSRWTSTGDLQVGHQGVGTINISNGGHVAANYLIMGTNGAVNIDGGTLELNRIDLYSAIDKDIDGVTGVGKLVTHSWVLDDQVTFDATNRVNGLQSPYDGSHGLTLTVDAIFDGRGFTGAGYLGNGSVTVVNGANIGGTEGYIGFQSTSVGVVTVDGVGSTWSNSENLYIGYSGSAALNIIDGGVVTCEGTTYVNYNSSASGAVAVRGAGSSLSINEDFYLSYRNDASLNITEGGTMIVGGNANLGSNFARTSTVTIDGPGSQWLINGGLSARSVNLSITNGGNLTTSRSTSGYPFSSEVSGEVSIAGVGSSWHAKDINFGNTYGGTLSITQGAMVVAEGNSSIGHGRPYYPRGGAPTTAIVDGTGSTWTTSQALRVGYYFSYHDVPNTLMITNGGSVTSDTAYLYERLYLDNGSFIANSITGYESSIIEGTGTITCDAFTSNGLINPGQSPGALTIDGSLELGSTSRLIIDIFGTANGSYDILHVTGDLTLAGDIEFRLLEGMNASVIDQVTWLQVDGSLTGEFSNTTITYVIPEPTGFTLLGLMGMIATARKNRIGSSQKR